MKKKIMSLVTRSILGFSLLALVSAGCSDGAHPGPGPDLLLTMPAITKFQISKVGEESEPSEAVTIEEGDSVLLEWEVMMIAPEPEVEDEEAEGEDVSPKADETEAEEDTEAADEAAESEELQLTLQRSRWIRRHWGFI